MLCIGIYFNTLWFEYKIIPIYLLLGNDIFLPQQIPLKSSSSILYLKVSFVIE